MNNITVKENVYLREKYYYTKHKSGLEVFLLPKKLTTAYALLGTRYGSNDLTFKTAENEDFVTVPHGIAHFLEHKMFENEDGVDTFERFAKTGASANAFTSHTMTAYLFSCTENFGESLEILVDFVTKPYFTPQTVQKEQGIIAQEIEMYEDNPRNELYYQLMNALYKNNPTKIPIAGTVESISKITDEVLYRCYHTFYNLSNMMLSVCGDVQMDEVLAVLDKMLPESACQDGIIIRSYPDEPAEVCEKLLEKEMQVGTPLFAIGMKDTETDIDGLSNAKKQAGMDILNEMLFGASSEFFAELYSKNLLMGNMGAEYEITPSYAFGYYSGSSPEPEAVFEKFRSVIEEAKKNKLNEADFLRCKKIIAADFIKSFDSTDDISYNLMDFRFVGSDIFDYTDAVNAIELSDVEALLHKHFKEEYCAYSLIRPFASEKGSKK